MKKRAELSPGMKQNLFEYGVRSIEVEQEWTCISRPEAFPFCSWGWGTFCLFYWF